MEHIFIKLFTMSISASWLILIILLLRTILKKLPRNVFCFFWALVAVRLICPISIESAWSLIPATETVRSDVIYYYQSAADSKNPTTKQEISTVSAKEPNSAQNGGETEYLNTQDGTIIHFIQSCIPAVTILWITGIILLILYTAVTIFKLHRKLRENISYQDNILLCDHVATPFLWGILHPKIILPSSMKEPHLRYVLAHEKAHIARHDHWWKPFGFALLIIHWFNPLIWVAYIFFCKDIELACDEKVIKNYDTENRKSYSLTLLACSTKQNRFATYPLAFGKVGVKERITAIMKYNKPTLRMIFIATVVCIALSICFLTNPKETHIVNANTSLDENILLTQYSSQSDKELHTAQTDYITKIKNSSDIIYYKGNETRGYITEIDENTITVDLQNWITEEDEDWKPEYDRDVGFKVVDIPREDVTLQLSKNCTYHILEHHQGPEVKLNYKKFKKYYQECLEMEYPVLWFLTLDNNQITSIHEQYRP